jgi:hypothetical protein
MARAPACPEQGLQNRTVLAVCLGPEGCFCTNPAKMCFLYPQPAWQAVSFMKRYHQNLHQNSCIKILGGRVTCFGVALRDALQSRPFRLVSRVAIVQG